MCLLFSLIALILAGVTGSYVLCPHSISGPEALYWAQQRPEGVEAIIGLGMAVPECCEQRKRHMSTLKSGGAALGITRWIPGISQSGAFRENAAVVEAGGIPQGVPAFIVIQRNITRFRPGNREENPESVYLRTGTGPV